MLSLVFLVLKMRGDSGASVTDEGEIGNLVALIQIAVCQLQGPFPSPDWRR